MFKLEPLSKDAIREIIAPWRGKLSEEDCKKPLFTLECDVAHAAELDAVRQIVDELKRIDGETRTFDAFGKAILGYKRQEIKGLLPDLQSYLDSEKKKCQPK